MTLRGAVTGLILSAICVTTPTLQAWGQVERKTSGGQDQALQTLRRYLELRIQDADWQQYSKFITWPDEPSWDCKWVLNKYEIGTPVSDGEGITVSVVEHRLGSFCNDSEFNPDPRVAKIEYRLVSEPSGWKVSAPIPDYPDIGADTVIKSLSTLARNTNETPERRAKAKVAAARLRESLIESHTLSNSR
jgi:hypothetical protein